MGNLVTNRINFHRADGATGIAAYAEVLLRLTPTPISDLQGQFGKSDRVWAPFDMGLAAPYPDDFTAPEKGDIETGLAILSSEERDLVGAFWECRDPFFNDMPPHLVRTAQSVLAGTELAGLSREDRIAKARETMPDDLAAGESALAAYETTGQFEGTSWRKQAWGVRGHAEEIALWFENGDLCVKFDTMNEGPAGWVEELAAVLPDHGFTGVSYDADNDYSLHFWAEEPGDLTVEERDDPEGVLKARAFVAGMTVEDLLGEDRLCHGEDEDPDENEAEP